MPDKTGLDMALASIAPPGEKEDLYLKKKPFYEWNMELYML